MQTSTILFLCGPALGHVTRCAAIAAALREQDPNIKIVVLIASSCKHIKIFEAIGCDVILSDISNKGHKNPAISYATSLNDLLDKFHIDVILQDCNPTRWLYLADFRGIDRIVVTNSFLTRTANLDTHQIRNYSIKHGVINAARAKHNLPPLRSPYDLYEAKTVVLADPLPLTGLFGPWPENHICYGPLCWTPSGNIPPTLANAKGLVIVGMGSTGQVERHLDLLTQIKSLRPYLEFVLIGKGSTDSRNVDIFDHVFDWLPLREVLASAEICITQGGAGMSYLALSMGSPVLVAPTHRNHELLGKCLERLGVGGALAPGNLKKLPSMRSSLRKNVSNYNDGNVPSKIAETILNSIK